MILYLIFIVAVLMAVGGVVSTDAISSLEAVLGRKLELLGARVLVGHGPSNLDGADLVVYSSSIAQDHVERLEAARRGLKIIHRAEALAELCKDKFTIAVTGTHGKTTTTALVGMVLKEAGRDPSIVVGGLVGSFGGNAVCGGGAEIVIEADESDSSFLNFSPSLAVITKKITWTILGRSTEWKAPTGILCGASCLAENGSAAPRTRRCSGSLLKGPQKTHCMDSNLPRGFARPP